MLKPAVDRAYCLQIVRGDPDAERRRFAAALFKDLATADGLPVVAELLGHADPEVQVWGVALLRVLAFEDEDLATGPYGVMAQRHANPDVRRAYADNFSDADDD